MSDLAAANERMDRIEHNLETLTAEIPRLIQNVSDKVDARFAESIARADDKFNTLMGNQAKIAESSRPDIKNIVLVSVAISTLALTVLGAFGTFAKSTLDANLTRLERIEENIVSTTVPRAELEYRIGANREALAGKVDAKLLDETDKRYSVQFAYLKEKLDHLENLAVNHREFDTASAEASGRLDLLSNRLTELQKESSGATLGDQLKTLKGEIDALQSKFITVPK